MSSSSSAARTGDPNQVRGGAARACTRPARPLRARPRGGQGRWQRSPGRAHVAGHGCDRRTAQRSSSLRIKLPAGSRKAQSRTPSAAWSAPGRPRLRWPAAAQRRRRGRRWQGDAGVAALGHHLDDGAALVGGDAWGRRPAAPRRWTCRAGRRGPIVIQRIPSYQACVRGSHCRSPRVLPQSDRTLVTHPPRTRLATSRVGTSRTDEKTRLTVSARASARCRRRPRGARR
jgi:hypothetical protein